MQRISISKLVSAALCTVAFCSGPSAAAGERRPVSARDLAQLSDLHNLVLSPDGAHAAVLQSIPDVVANQNRTHWQIVSISDGAVVDAGDGGDSELFDRMVRIGFFLGRGFDAAAKWSPDGLSVAYLRQSVGAIQVWRSWLDGRQEQMTHNSADVIDFAWNGNGALVFATAAPRGDLEQEIERRGASGFLVNSTTNWSYLHNKPYATRFELTNGKPRLWELDISRRTERLAGQEVLQSEAAASLSGPMTPTKDFTRPTVRTASSRRFGTSASLLDPLKTVNEPPLIVSVTNRLTGKPVACPAAICRGHFEEVTTPDRQRSAVWWSKDGETMFARLVPDHNRPWKVIKAWKIGDNNVRTVLETTDTLTDCNASDNFLICLRQTPSAPRTVVTIDLRTGSIRTLLDVNPGWRDMMLGETSWVEWSDKQGNPTFGVLFKPLNLEAGKRYPLVVIGYSTDDALRGDGGGMFPAHALAAQGIAALVYDHWTSEAQWHKPDFLVNLYSNDAPGGRVLFNQIDAIIDRLSKDGLVDPERVGIGGFSLGLNPAAYGLIRSSRFKTASLDWIRWNPTNYYTNPDWLRRGLEHVGLIHSIDKQPPSALMANLSLSLNVECVTAPILVQATDYEFAYESEMESLIRFRDARRPLEMYVFPNEQHRLFYPAHRLAAYERNVQWFSFWLQGRELPNPLDAQQYTRWHSLRDQQNLAIQENERFASVQSTKCGARATRER